MRDCYTIDIEDALVDALVADGRRAFAPPVSADLGAGDIYVWRTGGSRQNYVQDAHQLSIDCYADSSAEAMQTACELTGWLGGIYELGGVPVYSADVTTLPYDNPDPRNHELSRATFSARIFTRVKHNN